MKKLKIYIFLSIYLLGSLGVLVDFHYCGGELISVAFYHVDEDDCCGEDEEKNTHCCDDQYVLVSTDDTEGYTATAVPDNNFVKSIQPANDALQAFRFNCLIYLKTLFR